MSQSIEHNNPSMNSATELDLETIWNWNAVVPSAIEGCVHDLIADIAAKQPDALAVSAWDGELTYSELESLATRLAGCLLDRGIAPQTNLPLLFPKSKWTCVAMLGIIKAGCAVVALDTTQPDARLRSIVQQIQPKLLIASASQRTKAAQLTDAPILQLDDSLFETLPRLPDLEWQLKLPAVSPSHIVYISFTSGTTGQPKGACISHANVRSTVHYQGKALGFEPTSRVLDFAPYAFDVAWSNFLHTLCAGGCLCIATEQEMLNDLSSAITSFRATLINVTPTILRTVSPARTPTLETVLLSGEMPYRDNITRWAGKVRLLNTYGPTECTFKCAFSVLIPSSSLEGRPDIGRGVGFCTWIVDPGDCSKLATVGGEGELLLEGPMVGQGYLSDPQKSAEAFINDPPWLLEGSRSVPGRHGRVYRTGDLVKCKPDGRLVFLGRKETAQVKIRGQRVEIGDVEYHVRGYLDEDTAAIADVIVPRGSDTALLALYVQVQPDCRDQIKAQLDSLPGKLQETLPAFMIPSVYIPVPDIPLAATGKVNRKRLRDMGNELEWSQLVQLQATIITPVDHHEPTTYTESQLRCIWAQVLGIDASSISTAESFLRLRGDSIAAMHMVAAAREQGLSLTVADVFTTPILRDLAQKVHRVEREEGEEAVVPFSLLRNPTNKVEVCELAAKACRVAVTQVEDIYPCTALQQGMLAITARQTGVDCFSRTAFALSEEVDTNRLDKAWVDTVAAMPILRTQFLELVGEGLVQVVTRSVAELQEYGTIREFMDHAQTSVLGRPLCRAGLVNSAPERLVVEMHHSIFDGWTSMLVLETLESAYRSSQQSLVLRPFQPFVKYILNQNPEKAKNFWSHQLAGCNATVFPSAEYRPNRKLDYSHAVTGLQWLQSDITPSSVVRSALAVLLASYTNAADVKYGATVSGRQAPVPSIERIAGPTIATVPVRVQIDRAQTVEGLLQQVQFQAVEMTAFEQFGLQQIRRIDEDTDAASQFQLLLVVQPEDQGASRSKAREAIFSTPQSVSATDEDDYILVVKDGESDHMAMYNPYAMMIICQLKKSGVELKINFDTGAIGQDEVQRFARQFEHLLRQLCSEQLRDARIDELNLATKEDCAEIREWNCGSKVAATESVSATIARHVAERPDAIAVSAWDQDLSYAQLATASVNLAYRLQAHASVEPGSIVVLALEKGCWHVISMLALFQLGAIAVPVSASTSPQRAGQIIDSLQPKLTLTMAEPELVPFSAKMPTVKILDLLKDSPSASADSRLLPPSLSKPALILFTSGSTGTPKPIQWSQRVLSSNTAAAIACFGLDTSSRVFQFAGYDFDVSVVETFATLSAGGCLCIPSELDRTNQLTESLVNSGANWACLTPSVAASLEPTRLPSLKTLVLAGEKLQKGMASAWAASVDVLYNWYGPAEASVATSCKVEWGTWEPGVIGKCSPFASTWLVNPNNTDALAPIGAIAELCIEGPILATYAGSSGSRLNKAAFFPPSWLPQDGCVYRTGDLVKYSADGRILFLGRVQEAQRKINGQRVDLGDIERCIQTFLVGVGMEEVQVVAEIFIPSRSEKETLAVFFSCGDEAVTTSRRNIPVEDLEQHLIPLLPSFMIPKLYLPVAKIPLGHTGKIDRQRLRLIGSSLTSARLVEMQPSRQKARTPSTDEEVRLQVLWAEVLGLSPDSIFATDHFLRLGGDSITAMRLVALLRQSGHSITVADVFEAPMLEEMANRTMRSTVDSKDVLPFSLLRPGVSAHDSRRHAARQCGVSESEIVDIYPCTAIQEGLLALGVKNHGQYISRSVLEIQRNVDLDRLRRAWKSTVQSLHILRTRIIDLPGRGFVQVLLNEDAAANWPPAGEKDDMGIAGYLQRDEKESMGLGTALCRAAIVDGSFNLTIHHCTYDGSSLEMILQMLEAQYLGQQDEISVTPFHNFIQYLQQCDLDKAQLFWQTQLSNIEMQHFPALPSTTYIPQANEQLDQVILVDWPRTTGMTPSTIIRSAWAILQSQYVASNQVIFGATTSGRQANMPGIEHCAGPTIATVPVAVSIDWSQTIQGFLAQIQQQSVRITRHEQYGLQRIQRTVDNAPANGLFQTLLVVQPVAEGKSLQKESFLFKARSHSSNLDTRGTDPFNVYPLMLICELTTQGVKLHISFDNRVIESTQVHRLTLQFETILQQICASNPETMSLGAIKTASDSDVALFWERNAKLPEEPDICAHEAISALARSQLDAIAINAWDGQLSYGQLDELSTGVARNVMEAGFVPGSIIAVCLEKSKWVPVIQLAIWKSGCVALILSAAVPEERMATVCKDLGVAAAVISPSRINLIAKHTRCLTENDLLPNTSARRAAFMALPRVGLTDPAAILVSSGSTGKPKQILWTHRTLAANVRALGETLSLNFTCRAFQFASYDFDVATLETVSTLLYGGCLCIPSESERLNRLPAVINQLGANMLHCTPSTVRLLQPEEVPSLSTLVFSGEKLNQDDIERWKETCTVFNWYGPAECSVAAICAASLFPWKSGVIASGVKSITFPNLPLCWLVDPQNHNRLAPFGVPGEIVLEGPTCATRYIGDSSLTEQAFCDNPDFLTAGSVGNQSGRQGRIYRTGDLAQYDSQGSLLFLGRRDAQIKVRGQLVAPEEVECRIRQCLDQDDLQVVVDAIMPPDGKPPTLVGFIVSDDVDNLTQGLDQKLQNSLPPYAVPSYYISIPSIPTGPTGKRDRKRLQEIGAAFTPVRKSSSGPHIKPTLPAEIVLQKLWAAALSISAEDISATDSFLQIGNSIDAMRLVGLAREQGLLLTVAQIFEHPVLSDMASVLHTQGEADGGLIGPFSMLSPGLDAQHARQQAALLCGLNEASVEDIFPCTPLQEGLLSLTMKHEGDYIGHNIINLSPGVNTDQFRHAWEQTVERIPILRTRIIDLPGQGLVQVVTKTSTRWTTAVGREDYIKQNNQRPMGLGTSLMRYSLFPAGGKGEQKDCGVSFALTMHHSIYDGVTTGLIMETLDACYHHTTPRNVFTLQGLVQYIQAIPQDHKLDFWTSQFAGLEAAQFPVLPHSTYQPQAESTLTHSIHNIRWRLDDFTPSMTVRAAFAMLCSQYSGSSDVVFGVIVNGRSAPVQGIERLAAPTIATLPIRLRLNEEESLQALLASIQSQATQMIPYEQSGLSKIRQPEERMDKISLFTPESQSRESEKDRYRGFNSYALTLGCTVLDDGVELIFCFDEAVVDIPTVQILTGQFGHLLRMLTCHKFDEVAIGGLDMTSPTDVGRIWQWNEQINPSVERCVHDVISERAREQPDATAICAWDGELTYQELDRQSTAIAHHLVEQGVGTGMIIPLCFEKSMFAILGFFAVIKAGAAGLFLDPSLPETRLRMMLQQVQPILVLSSTASQGLCSTLTSTVVVIDQQSLSQQFGHNLEDRPLPIVQPSDLLYCVFTSGSTGTPKGCLVQHRNFCSSFVHQRSTLKFDRSSRVYAFSSHSFDGIYWDALQPLAAGGTVCVPSDEERKSNLTESIRRFRTTDLFLTPSTARWVDPTRISTLRAIFLGGEAVTHEVLELWTPHATTFSGYGPSECTVGTVYWQVPRPVPTSIHIGKGVGVSTWVVDPRSGERLSPIGTVGELWLEGPLVGQGYLHEKEKTASSFVESPSWLLKGAPSVQVPGRRGRLYKTGDLVKYNPADGSLVFVGRKDTQVKLRGQRIELSEVEHHLQQALTSLSIKAAVIAEVVVPQVTKHAALLAFIGTDREKMDPIVGRLNDILSDRVPSYMVPAAYIPIDSIPLTATGKTDRRQVREIGSSLSMEQLSGPGARGGRPPSSEHECMLQKGWSLVLGVRPDLISINSNFLRLGGDSISAMRLASWTRSQGISLTVQNIMSFPKLFDMSQKIVALNPTLETGLNVPPFSLLKQPDARSATLRDIASKCDISTSQIQDIFPCTGVQKSLLSMTAKSEKSYIAHFLLPLADGVDIARLKQAWEDVSQTTAPILRCRVVDTPAEEGLVMVQIQEPLIWDTCETATAYLKSDRHSMGLATPLTRLAIVGDASSNDLACFLTQHHAVYDGYSLPLLIQEVSKVYAGLVDNSALTAPFQLFIKHILGLDAEKAKESWQHYFSGLKAVPFPELAHENYQPKADCTVKREIQFSQGSNRDVTAATMIRAAWSILIARYLDTDDIIFGTMVTGRQTPLPGIDRMIAPLINAVPVRVKVGPKQEVNSFLGDIQQQAIEMSVYEQTDLLEIRRISADADRASRFNTLLIVQPSTQAHGQEVPGGPFASSSKITSAVGDLDDYNPNAVMVLCQLRGNYGVSLEISFDSKVVDRAQMEHIAAQFEHVLRQVSAAGTGAVEEIEVVSPKDLETLWHWNATVPQTREQCVHEMITNTVKRQPNSPAISSWDGELSYRELDDLSTRLALQLLALGVKQGSIIPLCFEKSMWHAVAALGAMKAAAACVAMDSTQPKLRLRSIVQQVQPTVILTSLHNQELVGTLSDATVVIVDRDHLLLPPVVEGIPPLPRVHPSDTLYVVFTSGSTGTPKGVITTHQNFASAATHQQQILHIRPSSRVFDFVSYSFDVSWSNHLQTLICGGCLCIPSEWERKNDIAATFNRMHCDYSYFTPSVARSLQPSSMPGLKCLAMGGEPIQRSEVARWTQAETILGIYGPAECAQALSFVVLSGAPCRNHHVGHSYGANTWLVVPGCPDRLAPVGAVGELLIEGPTVSKGYFGSQEKTQAAYIVNPQWLVRGGPGHPGRSGILYKTGDLLSYNSDGSLDFIGRMDGMVKLRGQRVELTEVEFHVAACLQESQTRHGGLVAEIITPQNGVPILALFLHLACGSTQLGSEEASLAFAQVVEELEEKLSDRLPQYMIPGAYIPIDQIPMTVTNKTDRRMLRELGNTYTLERLAELQARGRGGRRPSTAMEKRLQSLWASVLGVEAASISAESSFLRIGGESIAAMRLVAYARAHNLSLTVAQIFKAPRLSQMALLVTEISAEAKKDEVLQKIPPAFSLLPEDNSPSAFMRKYVEPLLNGGMHEGCSVEDVLPCTDFQACAIRDALQDIPGRLPIWILDLPPDVDFARLQSACTALVRHFEILHTVFLQAEDRFWQVLLPGLEPLYDLFDVEGDIQFSIDTVCKDDCRRPRRLGQSFIRFMALRHQSGQHRLLFRISHAQFDDYTWAKVLEALSLLYRDQPAALPQLPSYRQVLAFHHRCKQQSLEYWACRLHQANYLNGLSSVPSAPAHRANDPANRLTVTRTIPMPQSRKQDHEGISTATFFHAACGIVLAQHARQHEVVFGRLVTGRVMLPGVLQYAVGPTLTEVPVRTRVDRQKDTLFTVAQRLQRQFLEDAAHEWAGMEEIIHHCASDRWAQGVRDFGWRTAFQQEEEDGKEEGGSKSGTEFLGAVSTYQTEQPPRDRPEIYATPRRGGSQLVLHFEGNRMWITEETVQVIFAAIEAVLSDLDA
ncbi:putative nonribosomal peptide synthase [Aspergillus homomorphus CBS 101889]|uniref:Putative nonribosomal peptide synthase n=1 Tax=Aspergillus homomorphus (strain CBS 101889) TaxID=1450537 RepID=A0A395HWY7_ASPHC|nr:putative nonribosomal peptide synthase [Aspergillus homomorphus CBS 101889]RAL12432.1 putative nonribosomal peptide synthase [Aspergillus homomorphus CBS 101889]